MLGLLAALAKIVLNGWRIDLMGWLIAFGTVGAVVVALWFAFKIGFGRGRRRSRIRPSN